jgi:hypothetical protein
MIEGKHRLAWITIPNTIYNVNSTNNTIYWNEGAATITSTLPVGNYSLTSLPIAIKTVLDADTALARTYTVVVGSTTNKLTFTPSAGTMGFNFGTNTTDSAAKVLGFNDVNVTAAASIIAPNVVFLGFPLSLGINIQESGDAGYVTAGGSYVTIPESSYVPGAGTTVSNQAWAQRTQTGTFIVPLLASFGVYNFIDTDSFQQFMTIQHGSRKLFVSVINPTTGNAVDLNGGEWEMYLERIDENVTPEKKKRRI